MYFTLSFGNLSNIVEELRKRIFALIQQIIWEQIGDFCEEISVFYSIKEKRLNENIDHVRCVAQFGTIFTIWNTWKTPMKECYF